MHYMSGFWFVAKVAYLKTEGSLEGLCCSVAVQFVRIILDLQSVFVGLVWVYRLVIGLIVVSCTKGIA